MGWVEFLEHRTTELVAQRLRSEAVVIAHLAQLIDQAVRFGHSHRAIHAALQAGGLTAGWNTYRVSLRRARTAQRAGTPPPGAHAPGLSPQPVPGLSRPAHEAAAAPAPGSAATGTEFAAALRRAQRNAERDYGQLARDHLRRQAQAASTTAGERP